MSGSRKAEAKASSITSERKKGKLQNRILDLPAAAVTCSNGSHKASDYSRDMFAAHVEQPLRSEIEKLGRIGERRKDGSCNNTLGRCAEQHAASTLQNRKYSTTPPVRLQFSKAMRPRTMEIVEYCKNCKDIFKL